MRFRGKFYVVLGLVLFLLMVIACPKQRWAIIRKRRLGNWNLGGNTSGVQLTEAQRAARHAMNLALDPPVKSTFTNNSGNSLLYLLVLHDVKYIQKAG